MQGDPELKLAFSVEEAKLTTLDDTLDYSSARFSAVERVGKYLYVTGALRKSRFNIRSPVVGVLDMHLLRWRWIEYKGLMIEQPRMFLYDDGLYAFCVSDWAGNRAGKLSRFDLGLEEWSYCNTAGQGPGHRNGCRADYLERLSRFVVFAGRRGWEKFSDVHMLAMPECRWIKPVVKGEPPMLWYETSSCVREGRVYYHISPQPSTPRADKIFMLHVGYTDVVTWSTIPTGPNRLRLLSTMLVPFHGKILICGGFSTDGIHAMTVFDPEAHAVHMVDLDEDAAASIGHSGAAFTIKEGQSFGIFGGKVDMYRFAQITLDDELSS